MPTNKVNVTGRVLDSRTHAGLKGLSVEAWDKDLLISDLLGQAVTGEQGDFQIQVKQEYSKEIFLDRRPDLFFKIFSGDRLLKSTEEEVLWNVEDDEIEVLIELQSDEADKANEGGVMEDNSDSAIRTLAESHTLNFERAQQDRVLAFSTYPELYDWVYLKPCRVNILMVTDASGGFASGDFHLEELLNVLSVSPGPWVRFAVTKAHRDPAPPNPSTVNADLYDFKFDAVDLTMYDEIWMFGISSFLSDKLTETELRAVSQFMDNGGGVFATGDHEDLGAAMCAEVPRVRSMRKWYFSPLPPGEPQAPDGSNADRHDTNREGHDAGYQFDDQSDDVPQEIEPKMYSGWFHFRRFPHPVLCGPRGIIKVLPDHPHEGECYVPSDLTKTFTFDGYTTTEYPVVSGTTRQAPEVIANATVIGGHSTDFKPPVNAKTFGVIGAFDGQRANIGRVVVDATWHHFFNINLKGDPGSPVPDKTLGFYATAAGLDVYEDIKAYFRNIAVWLAPKKKQKCMRQRALWVVRWKYPLVEELHFIHRLEILSDLRATTLYNIGGAARDALGRIASQCQTLEWFLDLVLEKYPLLVPPCDPWYQGPRPEPDPFFNPEVVINTLLGGAVAAIAAQFPKRAEVDLKRTDASLDEIITESLNFSLGAVRGLMKDTQERTQRFAVDLDETLSGKP
jgi:hypothetical protein